MYGDEVSGVYAGEWRSLQRLASTAHSPLMAGRSVSALWQKYEDPTTSSLIAPTLRWSKEVGSQPRTRPATNLGRRQAATAGAIAERERSRRCNSSWPGPSEVDLPRPHLLCSNPCWMQQCAEQSRDRQQQNWLSHQASRASRIVGSLLLRLVGQGFYALLRCHPCRYAAVQRGRGVRRPCAGVGGGTASHQGQAGIW